MGHKIILFHFTLLILHSTISILRPIISSSSSYALHYRKYKGLNHTPSVEIYKSYLMNPELFVKDDGYGHYYLGTYYYSLNLRNQALHHWQLACELTLFVEPIMVHVFVFAVSFSNETLAMEFARLGLEKVKNTMFQPPKSSFVT